MVIVSSLSGGLRNGPDRFASCWNKRHGREIIRLPNKGAAARCYFGKQTVAIRLPLKTATRFILFHRLVFFG
ncbi:hypothetical protein QO199_17015 [Serratia bockelmannii]|jgi:hypothetical protein|uniref:Uncharacterized protein n=1 Tax=Serratia bockelmannii TaxID=2703793 RepID=A0ABT8LV21_9GAMM|nr:MULTISPECIES: hypothetical protein [Serratia]MBH2746879.1 hypothetical protein [Serratia marcescens]MCW7647354.1 hypothetical protein [Serratia bockelmannii]MCW7739475.1 hypothetical protein [Serratia bockelmannii]MDN6880354.1 hypothetical protein [Serratia bockelmannii]QIR64226.1 hypothetical protein HCG50_01830 [Serratia marcescens]